MEIMVDFKKVTVNNIIVFIQNYFQIIVNMI